MNEKYKKLTLELFNILKNESENFLIKFLINTNFDEGESTCDLINLIISSHISSLCTLINELSEDNKKINDFAKKFTKNILIYLSSISTIEMMGQI